MVVGRYHSHRLLVVVIDINTFYCVAGRAAGDGGRLVPLAPRLQLLVVAIDINNCNREVGRAARDGGRPEMVVGWYHSHPGFGCWLSGVDINTQQSFEALSERAVAVVVDPIQSVKGKVVIDAFRLINPNMVVLGQEPRQTTSNLGHLQKPSIQALIHGLNRHYYSIPIKYRMNEKEQQMLLNLHKKSWLEGLTLTDYTSHAATNETTVKDILGLAQHYHKSLEEEENMTPEQLAIKNVGKVDPKRHLEDKVDLLMTENVVQCLGAMLDTVIFK
ncbi:hypothetical protein HAZT_HAZT010621 [Hyalella azteca]|uniref:MPN domain-containing protein n=1 Tax=Hyalella azteca TaxID=294128 RepID=A0A6A0HEB0_HYAAZ|nr:hypothetical protein HAZT_HAZT010621 [Hyalella azteca]